MITFDSTGFQIDGKDAYLISGEFPYFRVPKEDWKRRMELFQKAGGNCVATYIPWAVHEPEEGSIFFGDCGSRDLQGFLETAKEVGLHVIVRPGPYVYTEMINAGLPNWIIEKYPQILALDIHGKPIRDYAASYLHPVFLEKARHWYRAVAEQICPYLAENGGPIAMVQLDNELAGIHLWSNSMDYNPETIGLGKEDGRYACFLREKYGEIGKLNKSYGTAYLSFAEAEPVAQVDQSIANECRRLWDYSAFYRGMMAEYLSTLADWLREFGITGPFCHNSGTPTMNHLFEETVGRFRERGESFLLGSDHYYNLDQTWAQNNPTPQYALRILESCETLRALCMPPIAMELPAGSLSDTPPITAKDMLACYMTNIAMGLKGLNYYIFTGGPNFADTGETCEVYDFGAPVAADGKVREDKYHALQTVGDFAKAHGWMQRARRYASVQVGFTWNDLRSTDYDWTTLPFSGAQADALRQRGILYSLLCSRFSPELTELTGSLDITRPLVVPCGSAMSEEAQTAIRDFVLAGGRVLLLPVIPEADLDYRPAAILQELLPSAVFAPERKLTPQVRVEGMTQKVFGMKPVSVCEKLPEGAKPIVMDENGVVLGFEAEAGRGKLIWLGVSWMLTTFPQVEMLETLLARLDAQPCVASSNRNIFTSLWQDEDHRTLFLMNLYSSPQSTEIKVLAGKQAELGKFELDAMEIKVVDL